MNKRRYWIELALILIGTIVAVMLVILSNPINMSFISLMANYVVWFSPIPIVFYVFFRKIDAGEIQEKPKKVDSDLISMLRLRGHFVELKTSHIIAGIGSFSAAKIEFKEKGNSTTLIVTPTIPSASFILFFIAFLIFSPIVIPISIVVFSRTLSFSKRLLSEFLQYREQIMTIRHEKDVNELLIDSLTEESRIVSDAYDAERSSYQDKEILTLIIGGLLAGPVVFLVMINVLGGLISIDVVLLSLLVTFISAIIAIFLLNFLIRKVYLPKLKSLDYWNDQIRSELFSLSSKIQDDKRTKSTFEFVLESSKELPRWLETHLNHGRYREPAEWILLFILAVALIEPLQLGIGGIFLNPANSAIPLLISAILIAIMCLIDFGIKRKMKQESARLGAEWVERRKMLDEQMEKFLREL